VALFERTQSLDAIEKFFKYARTKGTFFGAKCWTSKEQFEALQMALPTMTDTEKRCLGEILNRIIASAVPKSTRRDGGHLGYLISYRAMRRLERIVRNDGLKWTIGQYTKGSGGGDYWGIEG
jgi:hypothetical protein